MRSRAISVTELLIAVTILLIIAAALVPVAMRMKSRAKELSCSQKLSQISAAIAIYRDQYETGAEYGDPYAMGLPTSLALLGQQGLLQGPWYRCSGTTRKGNPYAVFTRMYDDPELDIRRPNWTEHCREMKDEAVIVADFNHNPPATRGSPFMTHRATGLLLGGSVKTVVRQGDLDSLNFWKGD